MENITMQYDIEHYDDDEIVDPLVWENVKASKDPFWYALYFLHALPFFLFWTIIIVGFGAAFVAVLIRIFE